MENDANATGIDDKASTGLQSTSSRFSIKAELDKFFEVDEYRQDILDYLRDAEERHRPKPLYMRKQPDISPSMRTILVDWLVEVGEEYRLQNETLCLAISYIDRFLSVMSVVRAKLQLVGTAAMFIAAKYEEIYPPDVGEFVYITDNTYTKTQVLRMEQLILKVLKFDLCVPTTSVFLNAYPMMDDLPKEVKYLAQVCVILIAILLFLYLGMSIDLYEKCLGLRFYRLNIYCAVFLRTIIAGSGTVSTVHAIENFGGRHCTCTLQLQLSTLVTSIGTDYRLQHTELSRSHRIFGWIT